MKCHNFNVPNTMHDEKLAIIKFVLSSFGVLLFLYFLSYLYFRNEGYIEHDERYEYINYSKGFVYDGHKVNFSHIYENDHYFAPINDFTRPVRWAESKLWEVKHAKGSPFPKEWKLPKPDKDWKIVLALGNSRSPRAFSKLEKIAQTNSELPSGKLASLMTELWDHQLRTFLMDKPRSVIDQPNYALNGIGHYEVRIVVRADGTVKNVSVILSESSPQPDMEEIIQHQLYCPAKDEMDYTEAELAYMIFACG